MAIPRRRCWFSGLSFSSSHFGRFMLFFAFLAASPIQSISVFNVPVEELHRNAINLAQKNDLKLSLAYFRAVCRRQNDSALYWNDLGVTEMRIGLYLKALRRFLIALELDPDLQIARKNIDIIRPFVPDVDWDWIEESVHMKLNSCIPSMMEKGYDSTLSNIDERMWGDSDGDNMVARDNEYSDTVDGSSKHAESCSYGFGKKHGQPFIRHNLQCPVRLSYEQFLLLSETVASMTSPGRNNAAPPFDAATSTHLPIADALLSTTQARSTGLAAAGGDSLRVDSSSHRTCPAGGAAEAAAKAAAEAVRLPLPAESLLRHPFLVSDLNLDLHLQPHGATGASASAFNRGSSWSARHSTHTTDTAPIHTEAPASAPASAPATTSSPAVAAVPVPVDTAIPSSFGWVAAIGKVFGDRRVDFYPHGMNEESTHPYFLSLGAALKQLTAPAEIYTGGDASEPGTYVQWNIDAVDWTRLWQQLSLTPQFPSPPEPTSAEGGGVDESHKNAVQDTDHYAPDSISQCEAASTTPLASAGIMTSDPPSHTLLHTWLDDAPWVDQCFPLAADRSLFYLSTHWKMLLIGEQGAGMFNHADSLRTGSWQLQLQGRKRWHLCSPSQSPFLYGAGQVDLFHPNYARFPLVLRANCLEHTLRPGQLLYYPGDFWHQTTNLDTPTVALSGTVVTPHVYRRVQRELWRECHGNDDDDDDDDVVEQSHEEREGKSASVREERDVSVGSIKAAEKTNNRKSKQQQKKKQRQRIFTPDPRMCSLLDSCYSVWQQVYGYRA